MYFLLQDEVKPEEIISENVVRDRLALIRYDTFDLKVPQDILGATTTKRCHITRMGWHHLYDPHAPRWPGSPGLIFKFRDGQEWPKIMRLIVRLKDNAWQYMGQYKLTAPPPLTPDEWNAQSLKVKRRWANKLSERKLDGGLKAKIVLRKRLDRDPTPQEVVTALQSSGQFRASADEILQACDEGQAVVRVWCMKCVGYDADFPQRIAAGS